MLPLLITVFLFGWCHVQVESQNGDCNVPIQHYYELGCVPVSRKNDPCPINFNCPNFKNPSPNKCYYKGKAYAVDEKVPDAEKNARCVGSCTCTKHETTKLICAHYDCMLPPGGIRENCYLAGDHNTCCRHTIICPPFDDVANCTVNGTVYFEGQSFTSPTNDRLNCICQPGFEEKYVAPFCIPVNCGIEIHNSDKIRNKCAPVFSKDSACPINWECETNSNIFSLGNPPSLKCLYGKKKLNIGDKITNISSNVKCECVIPPLLTCYKS